MDTKLLLVKVTTLLYLSARVKDVSDDITSLINESLRLTRPPENSVRAEATYDTTNLLRSCILEMLKQLRQGELDNDDLTQRFRLVSGGDEALFEALNTMLLDEVEEDVVRRRIDIEFWNIKRLIEQDEIAKVAKDWSFKLAWNPESINWDTFLEDVKESYSKFKSLTTNGSDIREHQAVMAVVDFEDTSMVERQLLTAKEELSSAGVLKCGYKGLNRMCGEIGGFRRGETLLISALRHNYKSGLSKDLFITIPLCNKPYMIDPTKKPLNLRISFEDSTNVDLKDVYTRLRQTIDKTYERTKDVDTHFAAQYIKEKLSVNGYHNIIMTVDPTSFTLESILQVIEKYEKMGYEIHHLNIDYLAMITKNSNRHTDMVSQVIQNLFTKMGNVCRRKKIFFSTPHQLGPGAKDLLAQGISDFVKHVAGKSFYDGCKRIDQEVDMEITTHKEKCDGTWYQTFQRGKHRGVNNTPDEDQYCAYKFDRELGLPYDYFLEEDLSYRRLGGDTMVDGGGAPLWDVAWMKQKKTN